MSANELESRLERAEQIRTTLDGYGFGGSPLTAKVWVGGNRVRVYLRCDGKNVGYVGFACGVARIELSMLGSRHAAVMDAISPYVSP
jgi:hypothetical protein